MAALFQALAMRGHWTDYRLWLLMLVLGIPALRAYDKYLNLFPGAPWLLLLLQAALYIWLLNPHCWPRWLQRMMSTALPAALILITLIAASFYIYPMADELKEQGKGSIADDALYLPFQAWAEGGTLYDDSHILGEAKASPGPGWIFANAPFLGMDARLYPLLVPFWLTVMIGLLRWYHTHWRAINQMMGAVSLSLIFWELTVTGHDALALSACNLMFFILAEHAFQQSGMRGRLWRAAVAALLGIYATARIIFPFVAPLLSLLWFKVHPWRAIGFTLMATAALAALHGYHYTQNSYYDPLHLYGRAESIMGLGAVYLGAIATGIAGLLALYYLQASHASRLRWYCIAFLMPLCFISFGELRGMDYQLAVWEGANYLLPVMFSMLYGLFAVWPNIPEKESASA